MSRTEQLPLLLRPDEAAGLLGISRSKTFALLAAGELPAIRIGQQRRIPRAALEAWIAERVEAARAR